MSSSSRRREQGGRNGLAAVVAAVLRQGDADLGVDDEVGGGEVGSGAVQNGVHEVAVGGMESLLVVSGAAPGNPARSALPVVHRGDTRLRVDLYLTSLEPDTHNFGVRPAIQVAGTEESEAQAV